MRVVSTGAIALNGLNPIAFLEVYDFSPENAQRARIFIISNEEFYIGRDPESCRYTLLHPWVSQHHLKVHCVVYDDDPIANVSPLVYMTNISRNNIYIKRGKIATSGDNVSDFTPLTPQHGAVLLNHGDEILLSPSFSLLYKSCTPVTESGNKSDITNSQMGSLNHSYAITNRKLGVGGQGCVYLAINRATKKQVACKIIRLHYPETESSDSRQYHSDSKQTRVGTGNLETKSFRKYFRELEVLQNLSHPNIISIEKAFWNLEVIYIFQELITGGDLYSYVEYKGGCLTEVDSAVIIRQVLKAVEYLHDQDIAHRDLKPDNILMTSFSAGARVLLTDFGNARLVPKQGAEYLTSKRMFSVVGTLEYVAPEVHGMNHTIPENHGYTKSVDMWSIGIITSCLLSGDVIFIDRCHINYRNDPSHVILNLSSKCDLGVLDNSPVWHSVSPRAKDFVRKLLVLDETRRLTAKKALQHKWFTNSCHKMAFDSVYERATRNWQPYRKVFRTIEELKTYAHIPKINCEDLLEITDSYNHEN